MALGVIQFDRNATALVQKLPEWLTPVMLTATFVGLPAVIVGAAALIAVLSFIKDKPRIAYAMIASVIALGANAILKQLIHRNRPDTMYVAHMRIHSYGFPSGHAFGGMVFYGLLAYLAYTYLSAPWNTLTALLLVFLIVLIGVSRVFLGAHFPSDVVAGWALGFFALLLILRFIKP